MHNVQKTFQTLVLLIK